MPDYPNETFTYAETGAILRRCAQSVRDLVARGELEAQTKPARITLHAILAHVAARAARVSARRGAR